MATQSFFLEDIRTKNYREGLSIDETIALDKYLEEMATGPGDGDMDNEWQSQGQGYYLHDHILHGLKDKQERAIYLEKLRKDTDTWLSEDPNNYMVKSLRRKLF